MMLLNIAFVVMLAEGNFQPFFFNDYKKARCSFSLVFRHQCLLYFLIKLVVSFNTTTSFYFHYFARLSVFFKNIFSKEKITFFILEYSRSQ